MSIIKIAMIDDTLRKVINTTTYNEGDVPADYDDVKYVPILPWMSTGVEYGWTDETKTVRAICGEHESFDENGIVVFNEDSHITHNKAKLIKALKDYRWSLFNTQLYVGAQIINVDLDGRQELSFNTQSFSAMPVEDRPATVPFKELDDAGWLDVDPTSAIGWQIMVSMADSNESRTAQKKVELGIAMDGTGGIAALSTKAEVDTFDVIQEFDDILKPVLAANLVKYAYPVKYHNEDVT